MDLAFWLELALFIFLLGLSGFFSSSETAMFSLNSVHLEQMRRDGNPRSELIQRLLSEPRRLIVTILIGNEFVNVTASVISATMVIQLFGPDSKLYNLLIMVPVLLLFGEITPKTLAIKNNIAFASAESRPIELFARYITPIRWIVRHVSEFFISMIVGKERSKGNIITEDLVRTLAHDAVGEGALDQHEAGFIDRIFELGGKTLEDVLTPRADITFIAFDSPMSKIVATLHQTRQSRFPVYGETRDDIIGILHARDLLKVDLKELDQERDKFLKLLRKAYFVPESKPALELFDGFRKDKRSFALTVDEYGGVTGLITMEDLLECIFGDIPSPSDEAEQFQIQALDGNQYLVDGTIPLDDFNQHFATSLSEGGMETLSGLVLHAFGELPSEGKTIVIGEFRFTASKVARNRLEELLVERLIESANMDALLSPEETTINSDEEHNAALDNTTSDQK